MICAGISTKTTIVASSLAPPNPCSRLLHVGRDLPMALCRYTFVYSSHILFIPHTSNSSCYRILLSPTRNIYTQWKFGNNPSLFVITTSFTRLSAQLYSLLFVRVQLFNYTGQERTYTTLHHICFPIVTNRLNPNSIVIVSYIPRSSQVWNQ